MENKLTGGKVTVLIPTYKRAEKLKRAVESVLNQSYQNFIIIISDNASGDETENIVNDLKKIDIRIEYFKQPQNIGMNPNFNFLVSKVNSPFFCLLTDDDYYLPNFLEDSMKEFSKYPEAKFTILSAPAVTESGKYIFDSLRFWPNEGIYAIEEGVSIKLAANWIFPTITACVFQTQIIDDIYFNYSVGISSDLLILMTLLSKYSFALSKKIGLRNIEHEHNIGSVELPPREQYLIRNTIINNVLNNKSINSQSKSILEHEFNKQKPKKSFVFFLKGIATKDYDFALLIYNDLQNTRGTIYYFLANLIFILIKFSVIRFIFSELILLTWKVHKLWKSIFR